MTRRGFVTAFSSVAISAGTSATAADRNVPLIRPLKYLRYSDPTTEFQVIRLTEPAYECMLPSNQSRFVSAKNRFLLCASVYQGQTLPCRLDLRQAQLHVLAETKNLRVSSLTMDRQERFCFFVDSGALWQVGIAGGKARKLLDGVEGFDVGLTPAEFLTWDKQKLNYVRGAKKIELGAADAPGIISPNGNSCLFFEPGKGGERQLWYSSLGKQDRQLLGTGDYSSPEWSNGGNSILLLRSVRKESKVTSELVEIDIASKRLQVVDALGRFASYSANGDGTVIVAAGVSKAQPHILLYFRSVHREFTLCEHRSSNPQVVAPVFSPNSQRVYFQSDREGKPTLYSVNVEQLVEATSP